MSIGELGKVYPPGAEITRQGQRGDCMYVIQSGSVEVVASGPSGETRLSVLEAGDVFGEMSIFTGAGRSATVRTLEGARVLTIDRRGFLRRVHEDPSLAFRILRKMAERVGRLDAEVVRLRAALEQGPRADSNGPA